MVKIMNYDEMLEHEREIVESLGDVPEKIWLIIKDRQEITSEDFSELSGLTEMGDLMKEGDYKEILEFGWVWKTDYDRDNFDKTYKLLEVEHTSDDVDWYD